MFPALAWNVPAFATTLISVAFGALMLMLPVLVEIVPVLVRLPLPTLRLTLLVALAVPELVIAPEMVARLRAPELEIVPAFAMLFEAVKVRSMLPSGFEESEAGKIVEMTPPCSFVKLAAEIDAVEPGLPRS